MSICHLLVKQMGGEITVDSELGKGTTFTVDLPCKLSADAPAILPIAEESTTHTQHLLLVEDNILNAEVFIGIMEAKGFTVTWAKDTNTALELFRQNEANTYDIILMDLQLPDMDGFEATQKIRTMGKDDSKTVRVFACTANIFKEERIKAQKSGMNEFVTKPIDYDALVALLQK